MTTETASDPKPHVTLEEITALAKRRGFIFQSSEIYGGIGGFFERTFAPKGLARIYDDVLANLEQVVRA